jgi:hypothetical protein
MLRRAREIQSIAGRRGRKIARFEMERPQNRSPMRNKTEIACPRKPRSLGADVARTLGPAIARLIKVDPEATRKILGYYVNNVWRTRTFVLFRNAAEPEDAIRYLAFLRTLGIDKDRTGFLFFDVTRRSSSRSQWKKALGLSWRHRSLIEIHHPPFKISAASRRWLAIKPRLDAGAPGSESDQAKGFRFLMVMAAIAFGYERGHL